MLMMLEVTFLPADRPMRANTAEGSNPCTCLSGDLIVPAAEKQGSDSRVHVFACFHLHKQTGKQKGRNILTYVMNEHTSQ